MAVDVSLHVTDEDVISAGAEPDALPSPRACRQMLVSSLAANAFTFRHVVTKRRRFIESPYIAIDTVSELTMVTPTHLRRLCRRHGIIMQRLHGRTIISPEGLTKLQRAIASRVRPAKTASIENIPLSLRFLGRHGYGGRIYQSLLAGSNDATA